MLYNGKNNALRITTKNLFILVIYKLFYLYKSIFCVLYYFCYTRK
jgi:hypothetical protein